MTELSDVFGEDLAKNVQEQAAKKRQERNSVSEEQLARICAEAVNENRFEEGEPQFQYTSDNNVTHTVLLMQVPELENGTVWEYLNEPWEGAASLPFDYIGEWMRCTFPDKNDLKKVDSGDWCIVVGRMDDYEKDNGEVVESVMVRGIALIEQAKEWAEQSLEDDGFAPTEEEEDVTEESAPTEEDTEEEESDDEVFGDSSDEEETSDDDTTEESSGGGLDGLMEEDDEEEEEEDTLPVSYEEIAAEIETLAEKEPAVWEVTEGDERLDKLTTVVCQRQDIDNEDAAREVILDVIEEHREDDEEEEEIEDSLF